MREVTVIFPNQLFKQHPALVSFRPVYLVEEFLLFSCQPFHKQRLVLLRAAMKAYQEFLIEKGYTVFYIEASLLKKRGDFFVLLSKKSIQSIHIANVVDDWLSRDLEQAIDQFRWKLFLYDSPMFLCQEEELYAFFKEKQRFSMSQFYAYQRRKLHILMDHDHPVGGQFSFDRENRKRLPKGQEVPLPYFPEENIWVKEALSYVEQCFPNAIGEASPFLYAVTFDQAQRSLTDFVQKRLMFFGDYEDAVEEENSFLFHSLLSPLLNIGLLTPKEILETVLTFCQSYPVPLNSLEGFIRQIIGWREFVRACYLLQGRRQRTSNYFDHQFSLPNGFWEGETGIRPVDSVIKHVLKTGYCHHIERLMVLGNFLLLTRTHPHAVYHWFMANFVDAYDWVMVSNVYGMSQYSDGGMITTKPYISGSNYILKMSHYSKEEWVEVWDGLFWLFLLDHSKLLAKNPRTSILLNLLKKSSDKITPKIDLAKKWLFSSSQARQKYIQRKE